MRSLTSLLQTDLEEEKAKEVTKLKNSLQEMQIRIDETNALLVKEREAVSKAIEEASLVAQQKEVMVESTEKVEALALEVERLMVLRHYKIIQIFILDNLTFGC